MRIKPYWFQKKNEYSIFYKEILALYRPLFYYGNSLTCIFLSIPYFRLHLSHVYWYCVLYSIVCVPYTQRAQRIDETKRIFIERTIPSGNGKGRGKRCNMDVSIFGHIVFAKRNVLSSNLCNAWVYVCLLCALNVSLFCCCFFLFSVVVHTAFRLLLLL